MTEVALVATVDLDDVANEDEHNTSDTENKEDDMAHNEDDEVCEDDVAEEESKKMSQVEDKKLCHTKEDAIEETDKTQINGVECKEENKENESTGVNGVAQDTEKVDEQPDTNEDQNVSDVVLKKEVSGVIR